MHYLLLIVSGVVMGLIAAVPIGPVNIICIRRTFAFGPLNGFVSGLGAALGDGIFAAITGLGLTWIAMLIEGYATIMSWSAGRCWCSSAPGLFCPLLLSRATAMAVRRSRRTAAGGP